MQPSMHFLVCCAVGELRAYPSYARHKLSVDVSKLSALSERGDLAFCDPIKVAPLLGRRDERVYCLARVVCYVMKCIPCHPPGRLSSWIPLGRASVSFGQVSAICHSTFRSIWYINCQPPIRSFEAGTTPNVISYR
jgi:hypothetical protein